MKPKKFIIEASYKIALRGKHYATDSPQALVLIVHGLGEHQGRYVHVTEALNAAGFSCFTYDVRGHGISEGKRGHIPSYEQLLDDLDRLIDYVVKNNNAPVVLYGHSMGGNMVANFILKRKREEMRAVIISSPWLKLKMKLQFLELLVGKIMFRIRPDFIRNSKLNPHFFSHDQEVVKRYIEDPKVHGKVTPGLFFGYRKAGLWALKHAHPLDIPLLLMQSADDEIVSPEASREFADKTGATFKSWEGMYHEPHNEVEKDKVLDFIIGWIKEQLKNTPA
jgi:alpha-beta hydrolase superfamily lysophospholipase